MKYYLGIDIGKFYHQACIINEDDSLKTKSLKFKNDDKGYQQLLTYINDFIPTNSTLKIGMEATRAFLAKSIF